MMKISRLQYITHAKIASEIISEVELAIAAGVDWVQLRMKDDIEHQESIALDVQEICRGRATFIINDHVDLVKKIDADGVHLGLKDMPISDAREIVGYDKIIGATANTMADCKNAELAGADYIGMGPFAHTDTKKELAPIIGLEGFKKLFPKEEKYGWQLMTLNIPVVAIGGIKTSDVADLLDTTLHGIAVSSLIASALDKGETVRELKEIIYGYVENS